MPKAPFPADRAAAGLIVGESAAIRRVLEQVRHVAATDSTVLLLGETGTGKEVIAACLHALSARRDRAMVRVNCSAIARRAHGERVVRPRERRLHRCGRAADRQVRAGATVPSIFLDEIGDLPADTQVKLLRVLEERQFERLGSPRAIRVDTRVIAATHRDLEQGIATGTFREDLFYRLNVFPIHVPPLRDRLEDIPLLVWRFVEEFSKRFGKHVEVITDENMSALRRYGWPGNIRELRKLSSARWSSRQDRA